MRAELNRIVSYVAILLNWPQLSRERNGRRMILKAERILALNIVPVTAQNAMTEVGIQLIDELEGTRRSFSPKLSGLNITRVIFGASPQLREKVSKILFCGYWREWSICISSRTNVAVTSSVSWSTSESICEKSR